jgi:hypothetical protein
VVRTAWFMCVFRAWFERVRYACSVQVRRASVLWCVCVVCVLSLRLRGDCFVCVCACCVCVACCVVRGVRGVTWLVRVRCVRVQGRGLQ